MLNFIKENLFLCIVAFLLVVSPSFLFGAVQVIAVVILAIIIMAVIGLLSIKWKVSKVQKEAENTYRQQQQQFQQDQRGYTSSTTNKKVADDVGDYVDFEEIKD